MSFLGNLKGPKESEIIEKLGPDYFGITWEQLEADISHCGYAEKKEIVPVRIDSSGEPYMLYSRACCTNGEKHKNVIPSEARNLYKSTYYKTLRFAQGDIIGICATDLLILKIFPGGILMVNPAIFR